MATELTVVGSINLDLVAQVRRLPPAGETLSATAFDRYPGGKGANQAVAAARLGAAVRFICAVGDDPEAEAALANLRAAGVELDLERVGSTGLGLILVTPDGENQIVVVPGANDLLTPREVTGAVLCQLEVPNEVVLAAHREASFFALNASPARPIAIEPDLLIVDRLEHEIVSAGRLVAVTLGVEGAVLYEDGHEVARAAPPSVEAVDGTAAGDAFAAALVLGILEQRPYDESLRRACAAGAVAATKLGAQPSLPTEAELEAILGG
jgi:ribokinase